MTVSNNVAWIGRNQIQLDICHKSVSYGVTQPKTKSSHQKNKNNKTKPDNLKKKEYLESYEELKKSITRNQKA